MSPISNDFRSFGAHGARAELLATSLQLLQYLAFSACHLIWG